MSPHRRLRVGIVGTGRIAPAHAAAARATGLADVIAIAGSDPERTARVGAELGIPDAMGVGGLLQDGRIDVVHIVGTNDVHAELAATAIRSGKQVVLEKPIALRPADAHDLVRLADGRGVRGLTALTYWGYPVVQEMRRRIMAGDIGRPYLLHGSYLQDWMASADTWDWRCDPALGGSSRALSDIGSHWLSLSELVTGETIDSVISDFGTLYPTRTESIDGRAVERNVVNEDSASVLARLSGGARAAVVVSQVSRGHANHLTLEVNGSEGTLAWDSQRPGQMTTTGGGTRDVSVSDTERLGPADMSWSDALDRVIAAFYQDLAGVDGGRALHYPTLADGARAVAVVEAAVRSASSGGWEGVAFTASAAVTS